MSYKRFEYNARVRRTRRVRGKVKAYGRLRLSVFRSTSHIYAQIIDDAQAVTKVAASSLEPVAPAKGKKSSKSKSAKEYGGNKAAAEAVGKLVAERAIKAGITEVAFDRGPYPYHGRVRALAEGARAAGLKF
ncbi:MAG: 50S ribosomal protein L18 [Mariprofundaceae bacterium]